MRRGTSGSVAGPLRALFRSGTVGGLDDEALLERFADRRDEDAFEALVRRHGPMVWRVCRSVLRHEHDARDAYQATFLILATRAGSIRRGGSTASWLFGVARRVALRARLEARRRLDHEQRAAFRTVEVGDGPPERLPEVIEEVHRLPERLRAPVVLCYLEGHTYESAASVLGCPPRTVHSRLRAARDRLRTRLTRRGLAPGLASLAGLASGRTIEAGAIASLPSAARMARMAVAVASGESTMAGAVPGTVLMLVHGGLNAMTFETLRTAAVACILLGGAVGLGPVLAVMSVGDGADADETEPGPVLVAEPVPPPIGLHLLDDADRQSAVDPPIRADSYPELAPTSPPADEPPLQFAGPPTMPWETVVRITVKDRGSIGLGSGTVIASTPDEAIILTCAHIFSVKGRQPRAEQFHLPVTVELFDGTLGGPGGNTVRPIGEPIPAEVIDYDFDRDVALIRIRPGRVLPASRVVPPHWQPRKRMAMYTTGCSHGEDATAWSTTITEPLSPYRIPGKIAYAAIECQFSPKQGRTGGGLFTEEGLLAGVCNFAFDSRVGRGLYAAPESIHHMLDRNGLTHLYSDAGRGSPDSQTPEDSDTEAPPAAPPSPGPASVDPEADRLEAIERRLDRLLGEIDGRGNVPVARDAGMPPAPVDDAFRAGLLAMLESGPVRLVLDGDFEVSVRLDDPGDLERARPILVALFALGQPIRIEPDATQPPEVSGPTRPNGGLLP